MIGKIKYLFYRIIYSSEKFAKTIAIDIAKKKGVKVGEDCRFYSTKFSSEPYLITIGNHVTISEGVKLVTHDGGVWVLRGMSEKYKNSNIVGKIIIGNNIFIGIDSIILPGVSISDNTIIAAGSVVTKSFPENVIIAGVPARIIKNIDDYTNSNHEQLIDTKNLSSIQKKELILNHLEENFFREK